MEETLRNKRMFEGKVKKKLFKAFKLFQSNPNINEHLCLMKCKLFSFFRVIIRLHPHGCKHDWSPTRLILTAVTYQPTLLGPVNILLHIAPFSQCLEGLLPYHFQLGFMMLKGLRWRREVKRIL